MPNTFVNVFITIMLKLVKVLLPIYTVYLLNSIVSFISIYNITSYIPLFFN